MTSGDVLLLFIKDYHKLFFSFYLIYRFTRNVVTMMVSYTCILGLLIFFLFVLFSTLNWIGIYLLGLEDKALASHNDLVNVEKKNKFASWFKDMLKVDPITFFYLFLFYFI